MKRLTLTSAVLLSLTGCADFHDSYSTAGVDGGAAYSRPVNTKPAYGKYNRPVAASTVRTTESTTHHTVSTARSRTEAAAEAPAVKSASKTKSVTTAAPAVPVNGPGAPPMAPTVGQ